MNIGDFVRWRDVPKDKPIVAWRRWNADNNSGVLSALYNFKTWKAGKMKAGGEMCESIPATFYDGCAKRGVYAFKRKDDAHSLGVGDVVGRVKLWGKVAVHKHGYRAEFAEVESLREFDVWQHANQFSSRAKRYLRRYAAGKLARQLDKAA